MASFNGSRVITNPASYRGISASVVRYDKDGCYCSSEESLSAIRSWSSSVSDGLSAVILGHKQNHEDSSILDSLYRHNAIATDPSLSVDDLRTLSPLERLAWCRMQLLRNQVPLSQGIRLLLNRAPIDYDKWLPTDEKGRFIGDPDDDFRLRYSGGKSIVKMCPPVVGLVHLIMDVAIDPTMAVNALYQTCNRMNSFFKQIKGDHILACDNIDDIRALYRIEYRLDSDIQKALESGVTKYIVGGD